MKRRSFLAFLTGTLAALGLMRVSARPVEPTEPIAPPVDPMGDPRAWNPWHPNPEPPIGPGPVWRAHKDFNPSVWAKQRKRVLDVIAERDLQEREVLDARHVANMDAKDG